MNRFQTAAAQCLACLPPASTWGPAADGGLVLARPLPLAALQPQRGQLIVAAPARVMAAKKQHGAIIGNRPMAGQRPWVRPAGVCRTTL